MRFFELLFYIERQFKKRKRNYLRYATSNKKIINQLPHIFLKSNIFSFDFKI